MSTEWICLLAFCLAAVVLLAVSMSRTRFTVQKIAMIGVMAALSFVAYEFFRIPMPGTGSSFHLGNTFTALTALLLDGVSGGLAGAIGLAMADLVAGDPGYAVTTFCSSSSSGLSAGSLPTAFSSLTPANPAARLTSGWSRPARSAACWSML